jgi:signal peptidase II
MIDLRLTLTGPLSRFGFAIAMAALIADQATKLLVLRVLDLRPGEAMVITPFLDLVLTFNRGISYGLFPQEDEFGRWFLVALKLAAAALFAYWIARTSSRLVAAALGLLIGGALGNALDRASYGAVVDFISFHAFGWHWYVFNLADSTIVAGVVGLLYDALLGDATKSPPSAGS